jgi:hypothetical protein
MAAEPYKLSGAILRSFCTRYRGSGKGLIGPIPYLKTITLHSDGVWGEVTRHYAST